MKFACRNPLFIVLTVFLISHFPVYACDASNNHAEKDERRTNLIQDLYLNLEDSRGFVYHQATPEFKAMFDKDAKLAERNGIACLDYDIVVQGQDYDEKEIQNSLKVRESNGMVRASFTNFGKPVVLHYKLVCDDYKCAIDDIIDKKGSTKQSINTCLDEL